MKVFELGQIFEDFGCLSTNASCGRNMAFYTIEREVSSNLPMAVKCSQRCSCVDARHFEINGQCTEELPDMNIGSTNTILTSKVNISKINECDETIFNSFPLKVKCCQTVKMRVISLKQLKIQLFLFSPKMISN